MGAVYAFDLKQDDLAVHIWENLLQREPNHPQARDMRTYIETFRVALKRGRS